MDQKKFLATRLSWRWPLIAAIAAFMSTYFYRDLGLLRTHETPYVYWDSFNYFEFAQRFYQEPLFQSLRATARPLFVWWVPVIGGMLGVPVSVATLIFITHAASLILLVTGLFLFNRGRQNAELAIAWTLTLVASGSAAVLLGHGHLWLGDFYVSGYVLLSAGLLERFESGGYRSRKLAILSALVLALGVHTKPVFLFWAIPRLFFSGVRLAFTHGRRWPQGALLFAGSLATVLAFTFPRGLPRFMSEQYLHNEQLKLYGNSSLNWISDNFFIFLHDNGPVAWITALLLITAILIIFAKDGFRPRGMRFRELMAESELLTILALGAALTLIVTSKDFRKVQYFFILIPAWVLRFTTSRMKPDRLLVLAPPLSIALLLLAAARVGGTPTHFTTFTDLGYDRVDAAIAKDQAQKHPDVPDGPGQRRRPGVFVTESSLDFNNSGLKAYAMATCGLVLQVEAQQPCPGTLALEPHSGVFRFGGWGYPGGFPEGFLKDPYVLTRYSQAPRSLSGDTELYNNLIEAKLRANDPAFWDGLELLERIPDRRGAEGWMLYRRKRTVSPASFQVIVEEALKADPDNPWNERYRIALLRLKNSRFNPSSGEEQSRRNRLLVVAEPYSRTSPLGPSMLRLLGGSKAELDRARFATIAGN